jgi:glutathione S-transferase
MKPHLISNKTCPFVQRSLILLREKDVEHQVTYVDLANKPSWFLEYSPRGKVPLLIVERTVLFESQAICEYLDETQGSARLMPDDPLQRARDRAWFAFADEDLLASQFRMLLAPNELVFIEREALLVERLARLNQEKSGEWLSGTGDFGLADVAVAPAFDRLKLLKHVLGRDYLSELPRLQDYSARLAERASIRASLPGDFEEAFLALLASRGAWVTTQRTDSARTNQ